ncbi:MAG: hypothetical protein ABIN80_03420 [Dyadobacter sp.]|uniref:hypothetical protein n=1 Tax=Dyadobacter sp. TaxID=1914288 RepID=UPI003264EF1B
MRLIKSALIVSLAVSIASCGPLINRETVVYGLITNDDGEPVDSILVELYGSKGLYGGYPICQAYSNKQGFYELETDVANEWWSASVGVDLNSIKLWRLYESYEFTRNQTSGGTASGGVSIGLRTRYDFKLIRK